VLLAKSKSEWRNEENQLKKPQKNLCTAANSALDYLIDQVGILEYRIFYIINKCEISKFNILNNFRK
jgi:hypothetical protein